MITLVRDPLRSPALPLMAGVVIGGLVLLHWWLAPLVMLLAVGAALAVQRPTIVLPVLFGAIYLEGLGGVGSDVLVIPITLSKALALAAGMAWLVHAAWQRKPLARWTPVSAAFLAVAFTMLVSMGAASSLDVMASIVPLFSVVILVLMVHLIDAMTEPEDLAPLLRSMAVILVILLVLAPLGAARVDQIDERFAGTLGDPNEWSTALLVASPMLVAALVRDRWRGATPVLAALLVVFPLHVLLSLSRAGMLTLLLISPVLLWLVWPRKRLLLVGLLAVAVLVPIFASPTMIMDRYETLMDAAARENDGSLTTRAELLRVGLVLLKEHWVTGVGAGMFPIEAMGASSGGTASHVAHNTYLNAAVEQGLLGMLSHAFLIVSIGLHAVRTVLRAGTRRLRAIAVGYSASIFAFAVMAATLDLITFAAFYFVLGVGLVLERATERTPEELRAIGLG